ncbi:hypothetical protein GALMADRAFT_159358, partial [Galerina marginata CBS 339.88]
TLIEWSGGRPPFFLVIVPGNNPTSAPLENLGVQSGRSTIWNTNLAAGTDIAFVLRDSTGALAFSASLVIQA